MKTLLTSKFARIAAAALAVVSLLAGGLAFATAPVFAATVPTPHAGAQRDAVLERAFARLNAWNTTQATNLKGLDNASTRLQALIDKAKAAGRNTTGLETALAVLKTRLADAQAAHDAAAAVLAAHNGFDANGVVTDAQAARQTVVEARRDLNKAHLDLLKGVVDLRASVRTWRGSNPRSTGTPQADETGTPQVDDTATPAPQQ